MGNVPLPTPEELPDDVDTLKRMFIEMMATLHAERRDKEGLKHRIKLLLDRLYGPRTERYHPDQGLLFPEDAQAQDKDAADATSPADADEPEQ